MAGLTIVAKDDALMGAAPSIPVVVTHESGLNDG